MVVGLNETMFEIVSRDTRNNVFKSNHNGNSSVVRVCLF